MATAVVVREGGFEPGEIPVEVHECLGAAPPGIAGDVVEADEAVALSKRPMRRCKLRDAEPFDICPAIRCGPPHGADPQAFRGQEEERAAWQELEQGNEGTEAKENDAAVRPGSIRGDLGVAQD